MYSPAEELKSPLPTPSAESAPLASLSKDASAVSSSSALTPAQGAPALGTLGVVGTHGEEMLDPHAIRGNGKGMGLGLHGEDLAKPLDPKSARKAKRSDLFTVIASGAALISDGYQNNLMTMTNPLYAKRYGSAYSSDISTRVSNALLVGAILGQISVGAICDRIGRKAAIVTTTVILTLGAIFATAAYPINNDLSSLWWWLTVARGAIGVGVGGEYPASSTSASEASNERYGQKARSGVFIMVTNFVLSLGGPLAVSIFLIVLSASNYGNSSSATDMHRLDIVWRVCFGIGILLPLSVFYFRFKIINSALYRQNAIRHKVPYWLALKRYWPRLLGTAGVWFLYDFVTFPNGIFSGTIIASVVKDHTLKRTAEWQLLLGAIALPGVLLGAALVSRLGSRYLLMIGFAGYLVLGLIIGLAYDKVTKSTAAFVILYGLLASSGNFGPGNACGLVSSDSYPTSLRGHFYGFSAAFGKTGAALGTQAFKPIQDHLGKKYTFIIAAACGVAGLTLAFFFTVDTTKLDLAAEDEAWRVYLLENGWDGELGDGSAKAHKASEVVPQFRMEPIPSASSEDGVDAKEPAVAAKAI